MDPCTQRRRAAGRRHDRGWRQHDSGLGRRIALPKAPSQRRGDRAADLRVIVDEPEERIAVKAQDLAVAVGTDRRRACVVCEERHFAEVVAWAERVDASLGASVVASEHAEFAAADDVEGVRPVTLLTYRHPLRNGERVEVRHETRERHPIQAGDKLNSPQQIALFVRPGRHRHGMVVLGRPLVRRDPCRPTGGDRPCVRRGRRYLLK